MSDEVGDRYVKGVRDSKDVREALAQRMGDNGAASEYARRKSREAEERWRRKNER